MCIDRFRRHAGAAAAAQGAAAARFTAENQYAAVDNSYSPLGALDGTGTELPECSFTCVYFGGSGMFSGRRHHHRVDDGSRSFLTGGHRCPFSQHF